MATSVFDFDRSLNALLYVANRVDRSDKHKVFKILYFADMLHLLNYGRAITGDRYVAMKYGPVPSYIYDMVKSVEGKSLYVKEELKAFFAVEGDVIKPLRDADMDYLSASDVQKLNECISQYKDNSFNQMTLLSHGSAWEHAFNNPTVDDISIEDILRECNADEDYISYIVESISAQKELIS